MKFEPKDWLTDTARLSKPAKALWIDILCHMFFEPEQGVYKRTLAEASRELSWDAKELSTIVHELGKVASVNVTSNGDVTVVSRRMQRDALERKDNAIRQARYRRNAVVTPPSRESNADSYSYSHSYLKENKEKGTAVTPAPAQAPASPKGPTPSPSRAKETEPNWDDAVKFFGDLKSKFPKRQK